METKERILTEKRLSTMEQKIDNLIDDVKEISADIKEHISWEAEKYEKLDNKYSAKWVEKTLLVLIGLILAGIVGAFFKLILI